MALKNEHLVALRDPAERKRPAEAQIPKKEGISEWARSVLTCRHFQSHIFVHSFVGRSSP